MNSTSTLIVSRAALTILLDSMIRGMIVLLLAGGAVCFMRRAGAAARHRLWLLAIIVTAVMPVLILTPGWHLLPAREVAANSVIESQSIVDVAQIDDSPLPAVARVASTVQPVLQSSAPRQPILQKVIVIAAVAWLLGAVVMGGRLLLARITLSRLARNATPASNAWLSVAQSASVQLSVLRRVRVLQSADAKLMPMTWGLLRPTILPPASAEAWPVSRQRVVILHELSHTKRLDFAWILLAETIAAVYWFNPLWRWALNQLRDEAEQACDDSVLAAGEDRCTYADELLATVKGHATHRRAPMLALGMSRCSTLEARLKSILVPQPALSGGRKRAFLLLLIFLIITVPLSQIRLEAQSKPPTTSPSALAAPAAPTTSAAEATYGGTLQDTDGKPIVGAKLSSGWQAPNRLGEFPKTFTTDAHGAWTVSVDPSWTLQHIYGAEPGYVRLLVTKPDHEQLAAKKLALTMERSVRITGYVRDEGGQPIVGALITPPLTWISASRTRGEVPGRIYSGADGKFSIDGLSPTNMLLYISAEAFAPALVVPKRADRPVIEMLSKGGDVPGIVLGRDKKPLANVTVTLTDWHYKGLHRFTRSATSDQSGRFLIRHVPLEGDFWLQASGPDLLSVRTRVSARQGPQYELQIVRNAKAHVEVLDDATGKPVTSFQYSVSEPVADSDAIHFADFLHTTVESQDAKFDVAPRTRNIYSADQPFRIRVTADNYMPEDSPVFKTNGESYLTIRLKAAKYIGGSVLNADGSPAANTEVAWVRPDRHAFVTVDGTLDTQFTDSPDSIVKTDAMGHFSNLKITSESGNIAAVSPAGYGVLPADAFGVIGKLTLKRWASLTGKFLRQDKPMVSQPVHLRSDDPANVFWTELTTRVGVDGTFNFPRAPGTTAKLSTSYDGRTFNSTIDLKGGQVARHEFFRND